MKARQRIQMIADKGSFHEMYAGMKSDNPLNFPGYKDKVETVRVASGEEEAVVCGTAMIGKQKCCLFVMESYFMMGSMGSAVGEKLLRCLSILLPLAMRLKLKYRLLNIPV